MISIFTYRMFSLSVISVC